MPPEHAECLHRLMSAGIGGAKGLSARPGRADMFRYRLTIDLAEKPLVLDIDEDGMEEPVRALVVWLTEAAWRSKGE